MKRLLAVLCAILFAAGAHAADNAATYYVPPGQFAAEIQVMDLGLSNLIGLFGNGTGSFSFDEGSKAMSNLKIAIDVTSLVAGNSRSQNDLAGLLGVFQFGEARFTSLDTVTFQDNKASIKGTLTLHGATKPVTMEAVINKIGKSPRGGGMFSSEGDAVGISMKGFFKRADFGMADDPNVPNRFGDQIALQLELQGLKQ